MTGQVQAKKKEPILALVQADQAGWIVIQDLPAEFRANRAGRTCDEYAAISNFLTDRAEIDLNRVPTEQVFQMDFADLAHDYLTCNQIAQSRDSLKFDLRLLTSGHKSSHLFRSCGGHGDDNFICRAIREDLS